MTTYLRSTGTTPCTKVIPSSMEIPKEILQKAAESALISSFVDLNCHPPPSLLNTNGCSTKTTSSSNGSSTTTTSIIKMVGKSSIPSSPKIKVGGGNQHQPHSQIHKVVIEIDLDKENSTTPSHSATSFFVKFIPVGDVAPRALKEMTIYEKLIPQLYPTNKSSNKSPSSSYSPPTLPHCFLTHLTPPPSGSSQPQRAQLFLENLKVIGFRPCDPDQDFFDFNHALLAVETLARFHAQSYFILTQLGSKAKGRMEFGKKFPFLQHPLVKTRNNNRKLASVYASFFEQIILPVVEGEHPSLAFKLRRKIQDPEALYQKLGEILENEKYENDELYVVCHGDFRVEHLLFKYNGLIVGEEPVECRMVDLKNVKLAPLASDLVYFMFTSLSSKMRDDFEEKLIAFYCDSFEAQLRLRYQQEGSVLKDEDFDIEDFHRKVEDQYKRMLEFGFYACVSSLPLIYTGFSTGNLENLGEVHFENANGTTISVLDSLENSDKFHELAKECLNSDALRESITGVVKRLVKARIF